MKTERITVLGSTEFKAFLSTEAKREQISVSELVRQRCEHKPTDDELLLSALSQELRAGVKEANKALDKGLAAAHRMLEKMKQLKEPA
jgi:hypothetical protein